MHKSNHNYINTNLLVTLIITIPLVFVSIVNAQSTSLDSQNENAEIILTSHNYIEDQNSRYDEIVGQVKNIGNGTAESVKIIFTYYDFNDDVIGTDFTYIDADKLDSDQKAPFSEFRKKSGLSQMANYEIALSWRNPDGSETYIENAQVIKENKPSRLDKISYPIGGQLDMNQTNKKDLDPSNWIKYNNTIYDVSLEYPENWKIIEGNRFKNIPNIIIPIDKILKDINSIFNNYSNYNNGVFFFGQFPIFPESFSGDINEKIYQNMIYKFKNTDKNTLADWKLFEINPNRTINENLTAISAIFIIDNPIKELQEMVMETLFIPRENKINYFGFIGNIDTFDNKPVIQNREHILKSIKPINEIE